MRRLATTAGGGNAIAVAVLVVLLGGLLLWQRPWTDGGGASETAPPPDASGVLREQLTQWSQATSEQDLLDAAGSDEAARDFAAGVWQARLQFGIDDVDFRLMSLPAATEDGAIRVASVAVTWRREDDSVLGPGGSTATIGLRVRPDGTNAWSIVGASSAGALPLWLTDDVGVINTAAGVIVTIGGGAVPELGDLTTEAAAQVSQLLGDEFARPLVMIDPGTADLAAGVIGRPARELADIAAITIALEGGTAVVLNPDVFTAMDARARQVVVSHETTHAVTGAVGTGAEPWVTEGFADYVALHDDTAPLSISAGQILSQVNDEGAPQALPSRDDFAATGSRLGAVYESAWLVFEVLARQHDNAAIVQFYRDVQNGTTVDAALQALGTERATLTRRWADYLTYNASTVS